jgi:hypothetical protein
MLTKRKAGVPDFFGTYLELEKTARRIEEYHGQLILGLLQTPAYARVIFGSGSPYRREEEIETLIAVRLERQEALGRTQFWAVMAEDVLCEPGIDAAVMQEQLEHIVSLIRAHRVVVQILPRAAETHALRSGPLSLLTLPDGSRVAYADSTLGGNLWDDPDDVAKCVLLYDQVRAAALPPRASLALIEAALEEFGT